MMVSIPLATQVYVRVCAVLVRTQITSPPPTVDHVYPLLRLAMSATRLRPDNAQLACTPAAAA